MMRAYGILLFGQTDVTLTIGQNLANIDQRTITPTEFTALVSAEGLRHRHNDNVGNTLASNRISLATVEEARHR